MPASRDTLPAAGGAGLSCTTLVSPVSLGCRWCNVSALVTRPSSPGVNITH